MSMPTSDGAILAIAADPARRFVSLLANHPTRKVRGAALAAALCALLVIPVSQAQALYLDFADFRGAESGNTADLTFEGLNISITSAPSDYDLTITRSGLGVRCTDGWRDCLGNQRGQIDAEWGESIAVTFLDGPVVVNRVDFERIYWGEVALVDTDASDTTAAYGNGWGGRRGRASADLAGVVTSQLVISSYRRFSDAALRGIDFDLVAGIDPVLPIDPVRPVDPQRPTSPIPEPTSALLFGAGLATAGVVRRR